MTHAPSRAIIDLGAYAANLEAIRRRIPARCQVMPVIKADGYGHGLVPIARTAAAQGAGMLAVACVEEGLALVRAGIEAPILVTVQPLPDQAAAAIQAGMRIVVGDLAAGEQFGEIARKLNKVTPIHCKIDTGMGRQGFAVETALEKLRALSRISNLDIEGVMTHFPGAEVPNGAYEQEQIRTFRRLLVDLNQEGIPYECAHMANSAGIIHVPGSAFDFVRPGIMTYGVWPVEDPAAKTDLRPVLRWESRLFTTRTLERGRAVGYGGTFTTPVRMPVGLVPVGYADGYPVALSGKAEVLVRGIRCPVIGRVSMDQIVIDLRPMPDAKPGETVCLLGTDGLDTISAQELATRAGTIPWEILTNIGPRVERVYID